MIELQDYNLKKNPFIEITASEHSDLYWAGMKELKRKIKNTYEDVLKQGSKQLVLNWGPYGGGKTFSAYYFEKYYRENTITNIFIQCPREGNNSAKEFFTSIIDNLSFETVHHRIGEIIANHSKEEFLEIITPIASSEFAKALLHMGSEDDEQKELLNRFVYAGLTKTELKKLGLAKELKTAADFTKFLSGIFACFTHKKFANSSTLVLWLDEMEELIYFNAKQYKTFSNLLRDLYNGASNSFLIFMNFSFAESKESTIERILGGALWSRISKKIRFKQFDMNDSIEYYNDMLNEYKINKGVERPFNEDTAKDVLELIPKNELTPREINKYFYSFISFGIENKFKELNRLALKKWQADFAENN